MARTQSADYGDRREAILDAAARLYGDSGVLGSSIADLAQACGMSKSLLYHYFSSKEDILFEIMAGHIEALRQVAEDVADEPDPVRRLSRLTHGFMTLYADASDRHKVLINDLDKLPPERRATIVAIERELLDAVDRIIAEHAPHLAGDKPRRRALTMLYFGMINWTPNWFHADGPLSPDDMADMVVGLFLNGIGK